MSTIWLAFITGLTTGGLSCLVVQGGLLASAVSDNKDRKSVVWFLLGKLTSYSLLGLLLGFLGSSLSLTPKVQGWMQIFAGVFMLITAARLADIHPFFKHFVIQPPKALMRVARNSARMESAFAPYILGLTTILIPCGVTQAMMVLAISAANPVVSAAIMAGFTLGTTPVFLTIGVASVELLKRKAFVYAATIVIVFLGLTSINSGQALRGSVHTAQNYWAALTNKDDLPANSADAVVADSGNQEIEIQVTSSGYSSTVKTLKKNVPVKLKLVTNNTAGCSRSFTIPDYNISQVLPSTGTTYVNFTPTKNGRLVYTCSMGMYIGYFDVVS